MDESMLTPAKERDAQHFDAGAGPSTVGDSNTFATPHFPGVRPQIATVPHPMITPLRARISEMEARLQELEEGAPNAITQHQADACMQQLAQAFHQLQTMTAQIPQRVDEQIQSNLAPFAQQLHQEVGGVHAALTATQQAATQAQNAAQFTAQLGQQMANAAPMMLAAPVMPAATPPITMPPLPLTLPTPNTASIAAPAIAAPMLATTDADPPMLADFASDHAANPMNPRLPLYTGATDPDLWIRQVKASFAANRTPEDQKGPWMVTALRDAAAEFWLIQCADTIAPTPHNVADKLRKRFRPPSYLHNLMARLTALKMQAGNFSAYADKFLLLTAQIPDLADSIKMSLFLNGLAPSYRLPVDLRDAATFAQLLETARRVDATMRFTTATNLHVSLDTANTAAARFRSSRTSQFQPNGRGYGRGQGSRGRGQWRSGSRTSRAPSVRPDQKGWGNQPAQQFRGPPRDQSRSLSQPRANTCNTCGKPGHFARDCYQNQNAQGARSNQYANAQGRGRGRGGNTWRGRGRGPAQGNASR